MTDGNPPYGKRIMSIDTINGNVDFRYPVEPLSTKKESVNGTWYMQKNLVEIEKGLNADVRRQTVLHETLHSVEDKCGLDLKEHEIDSLATGLLYILRHNKHFVNYLTKGAYNDK